LITDATIDELGIQVISFKRGLWRHARDPIDRTRRSAGNPNDPPECLRRLDDDYFKTFHERKN
jgi:hypothetical protein